MIKRTLSRRDFLKTAVVGTGALTVACAGLQGAAPQETQGSTIDTPEFIFGKENSMDKRILVAYATRTGSTVGVAEAIGKTLGERGFAVDVKPYNNNPTLEGYQAVILGSAVNGGKWLPEAVGFVENNRQTLKQMPLALFCVHIMNTGADENSRKNRLAYLNNVRPQLNPVDEAFFAGMGMNPEETSGFVKWIYRTFKIGLEGDCRDWEAIRAWAQNVPL